MSTMAPRPQLLWEDVREGQEIPGFQMELTPTRMVLQVSGTQDWYALHHDREFAQKAGQQDMFVNTSFLRGLMCRLFTDWIGDRGFLRRLSLEMRRPNFPGDTLTCKGRVLSKGVQDGEHLVTCEVRIENQRDGVSARGQAVVALPARGAS